MALEVQIQKAKITLNMAEASVDVDVGVLINSVYGSVPLLMENFWGELSQRGRPNLRGPYPLPLPLHSANNCQTKDGEPEMNFCEVSVLYLGP